jgi:hypothetical protein
MQDRYEGYEGDAIPVKLQVIKAPSEDAGMVSIVGVKAILDNGNNPVDLKAFVVKSSDLVYGVVSPDEYKVPGTHLVWVQCSFDDGSSKTFPVQVDVLSKQDVMKNLMLKRWDELKSMHAKGVDVVPEATRLIKSLKDSGYMKDYVEKMMKELE